MTDLDLRVLAHIAGVVEYPSVRLPSQIIFGVKVTHHIIPARTASNDGELTASDVADDLQDADAVAACYRLTRVGYLESGTYRLMPHVVERIRRDGWRESAVWTPLQDEVVRALYESGPLNRDQLYAALHGEEPEKIPGDLKRALAGLVQDGTVSSARNLWMTVKGRHALDEGRKVVK